MLSSPVNIQEFPFAQSMTIRQHLSRDESLATRLVVLETYDLLLTIWKAALLCCPLQNWNPAVEETIQDEIIWLRHLTVRCGVSARSCVRVSCEWDAAIRLCNDVSNFRFLLLLEYANIRGQNDYDIQPACDYIASYALDILNACTHVYNGVFRACGQEFDSDNYNVIVQKLGC